MAFVTFSPFGLSLVELPCLSDLGGKGHGTGIPEQTSVNEANGWRRGSEGSEEPELT